MKINRTKVEIAMAKSSISVIELSKKISKTTFTQAMAGKNVRPATVGRIAKALGVDVTEIIE